MHLFYYNEQKEICSGLADASPEIISVSEACLLYSRSLSSAAYFPTSNHGKCTFVAALFNYDNVYKIDYFLVSQFSLATMWVLIPQLSYISRTSPSKFKNLLVSKALIFFKLCLRQLVIYIPFIFSFEYSYKKYWHTFFFVSGMTDFWTYFWACV